MGPSPQPGSPAHPRWRGEHGPSWSGSGRGRGSSPLARGARNAQRLQIGRVGLIPAGAGSTRRISRTFPSVRAHPRWRGEHHQGRSGRSPADGSSPLARGARDGVCDPHGPGRLIPAGAGSTCRHHASSEIDWAHPRWRGEHDTSATTRLNGMGSSPLARGAQVQSPNIVNIEGLIPAGAGSTGA